ncbi:anaerobic ribonucleoside-triphosphate reductase activating protein [Intestinibaculum porci]|jgi:anaerobic ribonucleoside-triphosphate reductase activating protein|uniref:anaerobic ribonucleoside-triphosphate reductase activating protein n=1 Tax=Intestinibaculum porci TaxID=2487118 RepID=UPI00240A82EC|nr:anaerobic ribonucleoside-triphosphate reductase activating protein [Intestinibaculum porci]MDD6350770.1 anaerobic ribonucleoside-triphosphate reductase activating protein [Intestinibaculum porci]MDD6423575.1 anaerobic ribonucleoside-triphosphate reductase activating protein [Intestinibaculum porci]
MRYAQIREIDVANGPGIRVSLYTQGCRRHCPFCFNEETWDFNGGLPFTEKEEDAIITLVNKPHIAGLTILGGEPMEKESRPAILHLLKRVRKECPNKNIWLYSSFLYEDFKNFDEPILDYVDVLVDGMFINDLKDPHLRFRGSSNQRLINIPETKAKGEIVLFE